MKRVLDARAVRRPIVVCLVVLAAAAGGASRAAAQAGLLVPSSTDTQDPSVLSLREMKLDVGIARGYARVNVVQIFENHTDQVQDGTYRFALPPSAAVGDFAVWDGVVRIPGVILEKRRARAIYRDLTTQRIDPGLLQQGEEDDGEGEPEPGAEGAGSRRPSGGALFSVTVAPIPPRATKRLEIQFQEELPFTEGAGELRIGLAPPDGEPLVAGQLEVHVSGDASAVALAASPGGLPLTAAAGGPAASLAFSGQKVRLDRDLAVRLTPAAGPPLRLSAFRDVDGTLPDGVALAPWERRDEIPPEKDGFFLLEMLAPSDSKPAGGAAAKGAAASASRAPVDLAIAFDTSFSHRWAGLERGYAHLVRVLQSLTPKDRFALVSFDVGAQGAPAALAPATPAEIEKALAALRERPLGFGSDVAGGVRAAAALVKGSDSGRVLLISDGPAEVSASRLGEALAGVPLVSDLTGLEATEAYRVASVSYLVGGAADLETDLFLRRALEPIEDKPARRAATSDEQPFTTSGKPGLRDVYPVLVQPPEQGSLSGWVGRYANPAAKVTFTIDSPVLPEKARAVTGDLPEQALDARDLPRRWARARVDYLLERIELEGERREWVEEIIALSKRYKFVTPYTAFLAAPRSLLRPRRIQPGDPVLRVECDEGTVAATALLPFGERLPLVRRPQSNLWEGRFLVPEGLADGRYAIRIVLTDSSGARITERKHFVLDGTAPTIAPQPPPAAHAGERVRIAARADSDVVFLTARVGAGAPVPLRWDAAAKASVGEVSVPVTRDPRAPIFFEAVDGAKNRGFARAELEVLP